MRSYWWILPLVFILCSFASLSAYSLAWSEPEPLIVGPTNDVNPIALNDGEGGIWVVWMRHDPDVPYENSLMASHYDGIDWSEPEIVTPDSIALTTCFEAYRPYGATVDGSGMLCVAWYYGEYITGSNDRDPPWGIYTRTRGPEGWSDPEIAYEFPFDIMPVFEIDLTVESDGNIALVWTTQESEWEIFESIYMAERTDAGWSDIYPIAQGSSSITTLDAFFNPRIAPDDSGGVWLTYSEVYLEFDRLEERKIWVCYFRDGVATEQQVISGTGLMDYDSDVTVDPEGKVFVAWTSERQGTKDIYRVSRIDGVWSEPECIADGSPEQSMPSIVSDNRDHDWTAHCWSSGAGATDIRVRRSEAHYPGTGDDVVTSDSTIVDEDPVLLWQESGPIWVFWERRILAGQDLYYSLTDLLCGDADGNVSVTPADGYVVLNYLGGGPGPAT